MTHAARTLGIALLMILSSVFVVGVIAQDANRENEPNGHGIVIGAETGKPLHALVFIVSPNTDMIYTAETGEDGIFKIYLPVGEYIWEAEAENYHPGRGEFMVSEKGWGVKIVLESMEEPEEPEVPDFTVAGMLINARTNEGVHGYVGFINQDGKALEIETEEDGEFKALLPPGVWMWKAGARGYEEQEGRLLIEREPVRLMIKMVPLTNEEPEEPEKRGAYLIGHVMTPDGEPIPGAMVFIDRMMMDEEPPVRPEGPNEPPVRPGIPEEPPIPEERDPTTRQSENEPIEGITYRMFLSKLSEKFREPILERIFGAADADGDGVLSEREMIKAHELLKEFAEEEIPERPPVPEEPRKELPRTKTNERGVFKVGLPFGEYEIMVKAEGFHPNRMPVRISPRMDQYEVKIILEPMGEIEPPMEGGRSKIVFNMEDHNSDGNPESLRFAADLDGDGIHEIVYGMVDRNSDGNPESVEWVLDIPMGLWQKVMMMVMEFIKENKGQFGDHDWEGIGEGWGEEGIPFDIEAIKDMIAKRTEKEPDVSDDVDKDPANLDAAGNKDADDIESGDLEGSGISEKASTNNEDTPVLEILAALGVLSFILAILIGAGLYIRKKSE